MRVSLTRLASRTSKLKEVRIIFDPAGDASNGAREYVQKHYSNLKKNNPNLPILVRECAGVQPRLWIRYEKGKEISISLTDRVVLDVQKQLDAFVE